MSTEVFTDVIYQVGEEGHAPITIKPSPDMPEDYFEIVADSEQAVEYWGPFRLTVSRRLAAELGRALLTASRGAA